MPTVAPNGKRTVSTVLSRAVDGSRRALRRLALGALVPISLAAITSAIALPGVSRGQPGPVTNAAGPVAGLGLLPLAGHGLAHLVGALPGNHEILLTLGLLQRHSAALSSLHGQGKSVSASGYNKLFGSSPSAVALVGEALRVYGLRPTWAPGDGIMEVTGPVSTVERVFSVPLNRYAVAARSIRGTSFFAPSGPANPALHGFGANPSRFTAPAFHDVVLGDDLYYPATPGWDFATGWGSSDAAALVDDFIAYEKGTR
jgi:hypothetical protein